MTQSGSSSTPIGRLPTPADGLLLGADVGGTATRVALATTSGEVVSVAAGPAGNPNSVGLDTSALRIRTAAEQCLTQAGSSRTGPDRDGIEIAGLVQAIVVGLAGGARADESFLPAVVPAGVSVAPRLVSDLSVAFSSATPAPEGYVLVAGTGAVAGRILDGDLRDRRDGWGWLLGDAGSGFWLGREAVRSTVARLESGESPLGPLAVAVAEAMGTKDSVEIIQQCYLHPPIWLASFAELVSRHADDPAAAAIADRAADHLVTTLLGLDLDPALPVVLAGSVATRPGPVRSALDGRLRGTLRNEVLTADSGLVGALWLAAREIGLDDPRIHSRLASSVGRTSETVV